MFSSRFFSFLGLSTATELQKCFAPVNLSSIKSSIAPDRHSTSRAFLFSFEYTMFSLNKNSSTVLNGRLSRICSIAFSPRPLTDDKGWISVLPSGEISHTIPEVFTFNGAISNPRDFEMLIAFSLRVSGSLSKKAAAHSAG